MDEYITGKITELFTMPAVSVIVPVYKVEPYIARCARSLFDQTLEDLEFIFIDDCTPDRSMEVMEEVLKEYPGRKDQVRCFRMPGNSGLARVREKGISLARGKYFVCCDSDDELASADAYRLLYEKAESEQLDIVTYNYWKEDAKHRLTLSKQACPDVRDLLLDRAQGNLCCRLINRSLITDSLLYPSGDMGEDLTLSVQFTLRARSMGHVDEPLYIYRYHESSISKAKGKEAAVRKHRQLQDNVRMLIGLLEGEYGFRDDDPCLLCFKYYSRKCLEHYVGDRECYLLWRTTFPEVDRKVLSLHELSFEKKFWFVLIHLHLYPAVKSVTSFLKGRKWK